MLWQKYVEHEKEKILWEAQHIKDGHENSQIRRLQNNQIIIIIFMKQMLFQVNAQCEVIFHNNNNK